MSSPLHSDREGLIRRCYQRALTALRQKHDTEFQEMLADEYENAGITVKKRKSRMQSKNNQSKENE